MRLFVALDTSFAAGWLASRSAVARQQRNCLSLKAGPGAVAARRICDYNPTFGLGYGALAALFLVLAALACRSYLRSRVHRKRDALASWTAASGGEIRSAQRAR